MTDADEFLRTIGPKENFFAKRDSLCILYGCRVSPFFFRQFESTICQTHVIMLLVTEKTAFLNIIHVLIINNLCNKLEKLFQSYFNEN